MNFWNCGAVCCEMLLIRLGRVSEGSESKLVLLHREIERPATPWAPLYLTVSEHSETTR